jgi:hypothetical protein
MALRARAEEIKQQEIERIARLAAKRAKPDSSGLSCLITVRGKCSTATAAAISKIPQR